MQNILVCTPCGNIIGTPTHYGAVFRGVRYAKANRFELPEEILEWEGDYSALEFGACCPQMRAYCNEAEKNPYYHREFREGSKFLYSEDCLFLNLYVPKDAQNCPVIVFIHGGSFTGGSGNEKPFDGGKYAEKGVIFVTVNYRLNVFGFYADGKNSNGNLGLYDQFCAIKWLKRNISTFGGNPDDIVLMGQSAGAMSVCDLASSPMLEGQISGAIMLSGGGLRRIMLPKRKPNVRFWKSLAKKCGVDSFDRLKRVPAQQLFETWQKSNLISSLFATCPVIDDELIVAHGEEKYAVPCIIGSLQKDLLPFELRAMARRYAKKLNKQNIPCYIFKFVHNLPGDDKGTFHSADLWYAIGAMQNCWRPFDDKDYALSNEIIDRFIAFAKTLTPNKANAKQWQPYHSKKDTFIFE